MTDYPSYAGRASLDRIRSWSTFTGLHPTMQERVVALMEASGGQVGLGQGLRPAALQLQMFLDRHVPDPNGKYSYDGKRWSRLPGKAPAAAPGKSMHEIGLAADLVGDMGWVGAHAGEYGLRTFADVNKEPWHVQPVEMQPGRSAYEKSPIWGMPPWDGSGEPAERPAGAGARTSAGDGSGAAPVGVTKLAPAFRAKPGDTGPAVEVLVEALLSNDLPAEPGSTTYGPELREVVEGFQADHELIIDGIVGPQTWGELLRVIRPGDQGPQVRTLQVALIHRRLLRDTAGNRDGIYGTGTQEVVRQFQEAAGLRPDREVGQATWSAIIGDRRRVEVSRDEATGEDEFDYDDLDLLAVLDGVPCE